MIEKITLEDLTKKLASINIDEVTPEDFDGISGGFMPEEEDEYQTPDSNEVKGCDIFF